MRAPKNAAAARPHHGPTSRMVRALLDWFAAAARPLPWRQTTDPYAIWISEVMLQQTQVATVIPYWQRWMRALPHVAALAHASEQKVLKLWEGLGYYRRARHLRNAARQILSRHQGRFPQTLPELLALPGVGRYTAGAILSIAFNQPAPVLDGNVQRVLCRLHGVKENPRSPSARKKLWAWAEAWVRRAAASEKQAPSRHPRACSTLNQALMELGAVCCTPRQPHCDACPLRRWCHAHATGQTDKLPRPSPRAPLLPRLTLAALVEHDGKVLIQKRAPDGINANLWEFPNLEVPLPFSGRNARQNPRQAHLLTDWLRQNLGVSIQNCSWWLTLHHTITRHRYEMRIWRIQAKPTLPKPPTARWVSPAQLQRLPMPAVHRRLARLWQRSPPGNPSNDSP